MTARGSTVPAQVRDVQDRSKNARFVAPATLLHFSNARTHKHHRKFITKFITQQWQPPRTKRESRSKAAPVWSVAMAVIVRYRQATVPLTPNGLQPGCFREVRLMAEPAGNARLQKLEHRWDCV
jgi:hypothetical protein